MDITQKDIDEKAECEILEQKIREMNRDIIMIKSELLELYDLNPIVPNYKKRASLFNRENVGDAYSTDALKCCFYQTFMYISDKAKPEISIVYPTKENDIYGVRLKQNKNDTFSLDHHQLPFSLNPEKFLTNIDTISLEELPSVLRSVCKCVHAYLDRKNQGTIFKNYKDRIGKLSISSCCRVIRVIFPVVQSANSKEQTNATIILRYNELDFTPCEVSLYFDDNSLLNNRKQMHLLKKCEHFANNELLDAYKIGFE